MYIILLCVSGFLSKILARTHACVRTHTCMTGFVVAWRMRISLYNAYHTDMLRLYVHVIQPCVCVYMSPCVCRYTHTQRHSDTAHAESNVSYVDDICINT